MNASASFSFLLSCMPDKLKDELLRQDTLKLTEIRLRAERPVQLKMTDASLQCAYIPGTSDISKISEALSEHGLYARYDEARRGFITLRGGHRLGLCGKVDIENGHALRLCDIASLCLRIAHEHKGLCAPLLPYLSAFDTLPSVLILGAPGTGKTTLLRDLARHLSSSGIAVSINDERGELAACQKGVPQLDVGISTDVLDGCQKAYGIRWLIRSMSPQVIITDEISGKSDAAALLEARASGVCVMASAHAGSMADFSARRDLMILRRLKLFDLTVVLKSGSAGIIQQVFSKEGVPWRLQSP